MKCAVCGGYGQVPHNPDGDPTNAAECELCWHCAGTGEVPDSGGHMTMAVVISEMRLWLERAAARAKVESNCEDSHEAVEWSATFYAYHTALAELNRLRCYLEGSKNA